MAKKTIKAWAVIVDGKDLRVSMLSTTKKSAKSTMRQLHFTDKFCMRPKRRVQILPCTITIHTKARKANG